MVTVMVQPKGLGNRFLAVIENKIDEIAVLNDYVKFHLVKVLCPCPNLPVPLPSPYPSSFCP